MPKKYGAANAAKIPDLFSRGKNVYPIIPYRARFSKNTLAAANNEKETIDFDLQFEDNEVMDLVALEYQMEINADDFNVATPVDLLIQMGVFEDPDKVATTDLSAEAVFEDDPSLVHWAEFGIVQDVVTSGMAALRTTDYQQFTFPQPYTVARNIAAIMQLDGLNPNSDFARCHLTVWGRRRIASDAEFKNIIYRQRF